jgi:PRTRC genetic system protein A
MGLVVPATLEEAFQGLVRHHMATLHEPLPSVRAGICWIWSANGVFKQVVGEHLDVLVQHAKIEPATPGLIHLLPHVKWRTSPQERIPGDLLASILEDARQAGEAGSDGVLQSVEAKYFVVWRDGAFRVIKPEQTGTACTLDYQMPGRDAGVIRLDLHTHPAFGAYFSGTDDADDDGLKLSAVLGSIHTVPELVCRVNAYGTRRRLRATEVFDHLPAGITDRYGKENTHADC